MTNHKTTPCKACGASVIWSKDQNGTKLPVNKQQVRVYAQFEGLWNYEEHSLECMPRLAHVEHFLTCPGESEFSQEQGKQ